MRKKGFNIIICLGLLLGINDNTLAQIVYQGQIPGMLAVTPSGAATYTVPIEVPPGINGLTPELALTYNSQSDGNGPFGKGWSLSGLSAISRCRRSVATDGKQSAINLDINDALCLDGTRLVEANSNVAAGACPLSLLGDGGGVLFRTETDQFLQVCAYGRDTSGNGYNYFEVRTKSGFVSQFGNEIDGSNSKQIVTLVNGGQKRTLSWKINQARDSSGNEIDYKYRQDPNSGENVIDHVDYNKVLGAAKTSISFIAESLPRPDIVKAYVAGAYIELSTRITGLVVRTNSVFNSRYQLTYAPVDTAVANNVGTNVFSQIEKVDYCKSELDDSLCKISKSFRTTRAGGALNEDNVMASPAIFTMRDVDITSGWDTGSRFADVNGDGRIDIIQAYEENGNFIADAWLNTPDGWVEDSSYAPPAPFAFRLNAGFAGSVNTKWTDGGTRLLDLNGDGFLDIVQGFQLFSNAPVLRAWFNSASPDSNAVRWVPAPDKFKPPVSLFKLEIGNESRRGWNNGTRLLDLDGDGREDLVQGFSVWTKKTVPICSGFGCGALTKTIYVETPTLNAWLNTDNGWVAAPQFAPKVALVSKGAMADINTSAFGASAIQQLLYWWWDSGVRFIDLNGDGLLDMVRGHSRLDNKAWLNSGNGWVDPPAGVNYAPPFDFIKYYELQLGGGDNGNRIVDLNGDGLVDVLQGYTELVSSSNCPPRSGALSALPCLQNRFKAWINTGKGWFLDSDFAPPVVMTIRDANSLAGRDNGVRLADINGDGLVDIVRGYNKVTAGCIVNGTSCLQAGAWINTGTGWKNASPDYFPTFAFSSISSDETINWDNGIRLADVNGDGIVDYLLGFADLSALGLEGVPCILQVNACGDHKVWLNSSAKPYLLNEVSDSIGHSESFVSKPLTDPTVYQRNYSASYPNVDFTGPLYVVSETVKDNGDQGTVTTSYNYKGAITNYFRGFLGFNEVRNSVRNSVPDTPIVVGIASYNIMPQVEFGLNGTLRQVDQFIDNSALGKPNFPLQTSVSDWQLRASDATRAKGLTINAPLQFPVAVKTTSLVYDFPTTSVLSTRVSGLDSRCSLNLEPCVDQFGNLLYSRNTVYEGELASGGKYYSEFTESSYESNPQYWFDINKVTESTATSDVPDERPNHAGQRLSNSITTAFTYKPASPKLDTVTVSPKTGTSHNLPNAEYSDNLTKTTTYQYDPDYGYTSKVTIAGDGITAKRETITSIDYNHVSSYAHGKDVYLVTTSNTLLQTSQDEVEYASGNVISHVGPNAIKNSVTGVNTLWEYDEWNRKIRETRSDNNKTEWHYYSCVDANSGANIDPACRSGEFYYTETVPDGASISLTYFDKLGRAVRSQAYGYQDSLKESRTRYDAMGWVKGKTDTYYAAENPHWTCLFYNERGDVTGESIPSISTNECDAPAARLNTIQVAGLTTTTTLHNSSGDQIKISENNAIGQLVKVQDPAVAVSLPSGTTATVTPITEYYYGAQGALIEVKDAKNNLINMQYDRHGRKKQIVDPDMGTWTYGYNALGELLRQTDAKQQTVNMSYDGLGRVYRRDHGNTVEYWQYDIGSNAKGKLSYTYSYDYAKGRYNALDYSYYDAQGRLNLSRHYVSNPETNVLEHLDVNQTYDQYSRPETTTYPVSANAARFQVQNCYSKNGYLTQVRSPGTCASSSGTSYWRLGDGVATDVIDADDKVLKEVLGANIKTSRSFSPDFGRLTDIFSNNATNGQILQDNFYDYDLAGNLNERQYASKLGVNADVTETFIYDGLNRLKSVTKNRSTVTNTYAYDAIGNITKKSDFANFYVYDAVKVHAVKQVHNGNPNVPIASYTYDANGFMTNNSGQVIDPTWFGKPNTITANSVTTTFVYDSDHNRVSQSKAGHYTIYLNPRIDLGGHFEKEVEKSGTTTITKYEHYIYGATGVIGVYEAKETTPATGASSVTKQTNYFLKDHLGSIEVILNADGTQKERHQYTVFGKRLTSSANHHGFTGHEHLDDFGIIHMNGRLYNPDIGRFMAADPSVKYETSSQGFNRYSYTDNNPLSRVDLDGYGWFSDIVGSFPGSNRNDQSTFISLGFAAAGLPQVGGYVNLGIAAMNGQPIESIAQGYVINSIAGQLTGGIENPVIQGMASAGLASSIGAVANGGGSANDIFKAIVLGGLEANLVQWANKRLSLEEMQYLEDPTFAMFKEALYPSTETFFVSDYSVGLKVVCMCEPGGYKVDLPDDSSLVVEVIVGAIPIAEGAVWGYRVFKALRAAKAAKGAKVTKGARGKGVTNPEIQKLKPPSIPEGMSQSQFGKNVVGWGKGPQGALDQLKNINSGAVARMKDQGLTRNMAEQWRDFYANEFSRNANNATAANRVRLMEEIIKHY